MTLLICILLFLLFPNTCEIFAQCGCPGNSTNIGLANLNELYDNQEITGNNFFVNLIYKNTYADNYYYHDVNTGEGPINRIISDFMELRISYKLAQKYIFETSLGYLISKKQVENLNNKTFETNGFSDLTLFGRYVFVKNINTNSEFSAGTGLKIPLSKGSVWIPQNIQPSTGAYAVLLNLFYKKYFVSINSGLIIGNRTDYNFYNSWDYKYGLSSITSIVFINNTTSVINFGLEIRNDLRTKDYEKKELVNSSGLFSVSLNPLMRILVGNFIFGAFYSLPVYQYYNGRQIAPDYSFGVNVSYNTKF